MNFVYSDGRIHETGVNEYLQILVGRGGGRGGGGDEGDRTHSEP
jgi:hypothetical protein